MTKPRTLRVLWTSFEASEAEGYAALSLSVNDSNPARRLYESVGLQPVEKAHGSSLTMIRHAAQSN